MLFSTITFSLSITDLLEMLPDGGVPLTSVFNFSEHDIGLHLAMLSVDTILYFILAWYLDEVVERDWGSTKHWTFIFGYMMTKIRKTFGWQLKEEESTPLQSIDTNDTPEEEWTESVPNELKATGVAVEIRGLIKRFPGKGNI